MEDYTFSSDWAGPFRENATIFNKFKNSPINYLEIGLFEGRSACWMLDNILLHPDSRLTSIESINFNEYSPTAFKIAQKNLERHADKIEFLVGDSKEILPTLKGRLFDIIYIDGDHSSLGALTDSVMCWELARDYILWDDYLLEMNDFTVYKGVNAFISCLPTDTYQNVINNYQFGIRKKTLKLA